MKSTKKIAQFAGLLYLIIAISGGFSIGYLPILIVSPGDASATAQNIIDNQGLFKLGIIGDSIVFILEIVLTVFLYKLLKEVNKTAAMIALFSRMAMGIIMGFNLILNIIPLTLLTKGDSLVSFTTDQIHESVLFTLEAHQYGVYLWGLFFAVHLLILGYLIYKSGFFPKVIGLLMLVGSFGYFGESLLGLTLSENQILTGIIGVFLAISVIGELAFTFWLLIKGVRSTNKT